MAISSSLHRQKSKVPNEHLQQDRYQDRNLALYQVSDYIQTNIDLMTGETEYILPPRR